jgi:hypothetical protein
MTDAEKAIRDEAALEIGLSKRELIAAMAMQGLLANLAAIRREGFRDRDITEFAVMNADALIAELAKERRDSPRLACRDLSDADMDDIAWIASRTR